MEERGMIIQWTKTTKLMNYAFSKGLRAFVNEDNAYVWLGPVAIQVESFADIDRIGESK